MNAFSLFGVLFNNRYIKINNKYERVFTLLLICSYIWLWLYTLINI